MSLPSWVQEAIGKGEDLTVCLEMWRHASAVEREERMARREKEKEEIEIQRLQLEKDAEEKRLLYERDLEEKKLLHEKELEEKKFLHEKDLEQRKLEVRMRELDLQQQALQEKPHGPWPDAGAKETKHEVKFTLPKYVEGEDIDVFLRSFERLAILHKWDKSEWALRLVPQLTGKALDTYARLGDGEASDYEVIKQAILKRYNLTASTYKDKFRGCRQYPTETFREFHSRAVNHFDHWCQMEKVNQRYNVLVDVIMREQLINSSSRDLQIWLKERQPKTVGEMVDLAEAYQNAHQGSMVTNKAVGYTKDMKGKITGAKGNTSPLVSQQNKFEKKCFLCNRVGHFMSSCPLRKPGIKGAVGWKPAGDKQGTIQASGGKEKAGLIHSPTKSKDGVSVELPVSVKDKMEVIPDNRDRGLKLEEGFVNGKSASVLRDTGCTSILVSEKLVTSDDMTGAMSEVTLANGSSQRCPEVWIHVDTQYVKGKVVALVLNSPFADLIVGNYTRVDIPEQKQSKVRESLDESCQAVETRSAAKQKEHSQVEEKLELGSDVNVMDSKEEWIQEKGKDPSLERLRKSIDKKCTDDGESYITKEKGLLYRVFKTDKDSLLKQLVVPAKFRGQILSMGHDIPLAGHLGIKKTRERILTNFFLARYF
ncbi:uncharacterized protein LOC134265323 [Saccostrea cucullata]|uniref:uncharacterized protein LOC134265323 n=1 Tax=Saccostrea cuccullata TaxID=36930 RepID=UPI002ED19E86